MAFSFFPGSLNCYLSLGPALNIPGAGPVRRAQLREAQVPLPAARSTCAPPADSCGAQGPSRRREDPRGRAAWSRVRLGVGEGQAPRGARENRASEGLGDPADDAQGWAASSGRGRRGGAEVSRLSPCASWRLPPVEPCGSRWRLSWDHLSRVGLPRPSLDRLRAP